jgi:hypothetical protein
VSEHHLCEFRDKLCEALGRELVLKEKIEQLKAALREARGYIEHCDHEPAIDTIDAALRR